MGLGSKALPQVALLKRRQRENRRHRSPSFSKQGRGPRGKRLPKASHWKIYTYAPEFRYNNWLRRPLAIEAFDAAGGTDYTGAKVPVTFRRGGHWRFRGELMSPFGGSALSAITVQALADLGYVVDVSQADPFRLPGSAKAVAGPGLDLHDGILQGPIEVVDEDGYVVRVIHP